MRRIAVCFVQLVAMAVVLLQVSRALAPATGTPKFGSFGGGPFDVINLGNLNTHFTVPVIHKAGRAGLQSSEMFSRPKRRELEPQQRVQHRCRSNRRCYQMPPRFADLQAVHERLSLLSLR